MTFGVSARRRLLTIAAVGFLATTLDARQGGADRARAALEQMAAAYKALDAYHVKVKWSAKYSGMSAEDFPPPGPDEMELRLQKPNTLFLSAATKRDGKTWKYQIVSDGTSLWFWRSSTNTYLQMPAPATFVEFEKRLPDDAIGTHMGNEWSADTILEWDVLVAAEPGMISAHPGVVLAMRPQERIGGAPVNVVQFKTEQSPMVGIDMSTTVYLSAITHLVRGMRIVTMGKHPETSRDFNVTMTATYDVQNTQPRFTAADFTFAVPAGAIRK